jgi:hypothetical protein
VSGNAGVPLEKLFNAFSQMLDRTLPPPSNAKPGRVRELILESIQQSQSMFLSHTPGSK